MEDVTIKGRARLANLLGVSVNGVITMEQRGLPILKKGTRGLDPNIYHLPSVFAWRLEDQQRNFLNAIGGENREKLALRRAMAETRRAEIDVAKLEDSVVDVDLVRRGLEDVAINFRTIALSVPAQIGREIEEPEMRVRVVKIVDRRIREMLEGLSNYDPVIEPHDDDADQDEAATDPPAEEAAAVPEQRRSKKR
jgi:phage terminase Nu1 subunit (DNA packaging protein)